MIEAVQGLFLKIEEEQALIVDVPLLIDEAVSVRKW